MKRVLLRIFALLAGIGIGLICLELFLRINPKFGYIYKSFKLLNTKDSQAQYFESQCKRPSALLGYEHIPHGQNGRINFYGLIGKEYRLEKQKGVYRILVLGDSIAERGWSCDFLEDLLNRNPLLQSKYKKFEIWNAGVGSYDVRRYALYLKYKGLNYKPDMILIFLFMNDFNPDLNIYYKTNSGAVAYYFPLSEISRIYNVSSFLMKHSYLYRFVILKIDSYLVGKKKKRGINPLEENGRYYLQMIKEICQKHEIRLFVVIFPYLKPLDKYKDYQIQEYQTICKVTEDLSLGHINLYKQLLGQDLISLRERKEDEIHLSRRPPPHY